MKRKNWLLREQLRGCEPTLAALSFLRTHLYYAHPANLEATTKGDMKNKDYMEMIGVLNTPHEFQRYSLHELSITGVQ